MAHFTGYNGELKSLNLLTVMASVNSGDNENDDDDPTELVTMKVKTRWRGEQRVMTKTMAIRAGFK